MNADNDSRFKPVWRDNPLCIDTLPSGTKFVDALNKRLSQLSAMTTMTYGEQGEAFRRLNETIQDDYMWALSDMVGEIKALLDAYTGQK